MPQISLHAPGPATPPPNSYTLPVPQACSLQEVTESKSNSGKRSARKNGLPSLRRSASTHRLQPVFFPSAHRSGSADIEIIAAEAAQQFQKESRAVLSHYQAAKAQPFCAGMLKQDDGRPPPFAGCDTSSRRTRSQWSRPPSGRYPRSAAPSLRWWPDLYALAELGDADHGRGDLGSIVTSAPAAWRSWAMS